MRKMKRDMGKQRKTASTKFLSLRTGVGTKRRSKTAMKEKCENCLWNWENVHTGKGRVCYHNVSERYHQEAGGQACCWFEYRVKEGYSR